MGACVPRVGGGETSSCPNLLEMVTTQWPDSENMSNWLSHSHSLICEFLHVFINKLSASIEEVGSTYWMKLHPLQTLAGLFKHKNNSCPCPKEV